MILELISKVAFSSGVWYFMEEKSHSFFDFVLIDSTQRKDRLSSLVPLALTAPKPSP